MPKHKPITVEEKELLANVIRFMRNEAKNGCQIPLHKFRERVLAATGITKSTFHRVSRELVEVDSGNLPAMIPPKKSTGRSAFRISTEEADKIRCIINECLLEEQQPSLKCILQKVQEAGVCYDGSLSTFRKIVRNVGFKWEKINTKVVLTKCLVAKDLTFTLNSGDLMPMVGLGTYQLDGHFLKDSLNYALAAGYRLIDTAAVYRNEESIGKLLKELLPKYKLTREDIFLTTKLAPGDLGETAYKALQISLKKLDCDYVDLYLINWPGSHSTGSEKKTDSQLRDESWKQMVKCVADGLARNIGVSNYNIKHMKELLNKDHGIKPAVNQVEWHPNYYQPELLSFLKKEGILLQAYSSLGGTGNKELLTNPEIKKIGNKLKKDHAQILLRWSVQQGVAVIPKARSRKHINSNIDIDFKLCVEDMVTLNNLNQVKYGWNPDIVK